jgi:uncharacterized protein YodC (DUF2158 family)
VTEFTPGDVVVLKSGSMRMLVERVEGDSVSVVWANDGGIGRDTLPVFALNKWEDRGDRPAPRPRAPRSDEGGDRPYRPRAPRGEDGDERPARSYGEKKAYGDKKPYGEKKSFGDKPPRTGMDGKPKQKTFYRKDE